MELLSSGHRLALPSAPRCLGSALARAATRRVASPGTFDLGVSVSKADGEVATASVTITVVAGTVPTVSVRAPMATKHNANEALRLIGSAVLEDNSNQPLT